jgi:hypothetical protein
MKRKQIQIDTMLDYYLTIASSSLSSEKPRWLIRDGSYKDRS